jgi:DNA-binding SARP family transcriptional activator
VEQVEALCERAADEAPTAAARTLRRALDLFRGEPLSDLAYERFAAPAIARFSELRLRVLELRIDADLAAARHAELVPELEELVAMHPVAEGFRAQLMLALYRCGRQADALERYRAGRELLDRELGLEPGTGAEGIGGADPAP